MRYTSETSGVRDALARYCVGDGVDVGYGGDPIVPSAICLDMLKPYADTGDHPQHLHGTAFDLPFKDGTLDYVYSSHLIEDFPYPAQQVLVHEWLRVVKRGGLVIICAPDEQRYREVCAANGKRSNCAHENMDYCLAQFKRQVLDSQFILATAIGERDGTGISGYSWWIVLKKRVKANERAVEIVI